MSPSCWTISAEVDMDPCQYGGLKVCGTHLLVEQITDILEHLDDNQPCVSIMSIDLAKAFNCMSHALCLWNLASMGASNQTINVVANFLTGRSMRIKLNGALSTPRDIP